MNTEPTQQQIIQNWLKDNLGGHTPREISNGTGILIGSVRSHLTSLVAAGCLLVASYDGPGKNKRYCWTSHCNAVPDRKRPPRLSDNPKKFKSAVVQSAISTISRRERGHGVKPQSLPTLAVLAGINTCQSKTSWPLRWLLDNVASTAKKPPVRSRRRSTIQ